MAVLWAVGVEGIYGSPMPFYALLSPVFDSLVIPSGAAASALFAYALLRRRVPGARSSGAAYWVLAGAAGAVFAGAWLRETVLAGPGGWSRSAALWRDLRWHLAAVAVFAGGAWGLAVELRRLDWLQREPTPRDARRLLLGLLGFAVIFAAAVAMIRGGPAAISHAYARHGYEYVADIGTASGIRALFRDYMRLRPYLSMHARVHPPGPIALLWLLSYGVTQDPLALSLATLILGAAGLVPFYMWTADLWGRRAALTASMLYTVTPSLTLFSATSADVLFLPFTLATVLFFWRAIHGAAARSVVYAVGAGCLYALCTLLSFSLASLGAFFALVGLWRLAGGPNRVAVVRTAVLMLASFLAVHLAVRWWSGFDAAACFHACKAQFDLDQANLDMYTPRYPGWVWRIANPVCWFYFAGIPAALMFVWSLRQAGPYRSLCAVLALTVAALSLLYLGRGEGERSALYVFPFVLAPAGQWLDATIGRTRSLGPMAACLGFLGFQCWFTESVFFTFW